MKTYGKTTLDGHYFRTSGFYFLCIPIAVPYKKIYARAETAGLRQKTAHGPILESAPVFGAGWIGVEVEAPVQPRPGVVHVAGDFETYEHRGPYKTLGRAYQKLRRERPGQWEFFNLYLDDPAATAPADCRTVIHFRAR
jgi:hypothetical protein